MKRDLFEFIVSHRRKGGRGRRSVLKFAWRRKEGGFTRGHVKVCIVLSWQSVSKWPPSISDAKWPHTKRLRSPRCAKWRVDELDNLLPPLAYGRTTLEGIFGVERDDRREEGGDSFIENCRKFVWKLYRCGVTRCYTRWWNFSEILWFNGCNLWKNRMRERRLENF